MYSDDVKRNFVSYYIYVAASHDNANAGIYTKCSLRVWGLEKSLHRVNMKSVVHFSNF